MFKLSHDMLFQEASIVTLPSLSPHHPWNILWGLKPPLDPFQKLCNSNSTVHISLTEGFDISRGWQGPVRQTNWKKWVSLIWISRGAGWKKISPVAEIWIFSGTTHSSKELYSLQWLSQMMNNGSVSGRKHRLNLSYIVTVYKTKTDTCWPMYLIKNYPALRLFI